MPSQASVASPSKSRKGSSRLSDYTSAAMRKGGGPPAKSDTVPAMLTPGETVIPKGLSEEALAPLVAIFQKQGYVTQADIEQYLYPILQDLEAGDVQGFADGGLIGGISDWLGQKTHGVLGTDPNVLRNRQEIAQMNAAPYQPPGGAFDQNAFNADLSRFHKQAPDLGHAISSPAVKIDYSPSINQKPAMGSSLPSGVYRQPGTNSFSDRPASAGSSTRVGMSPMQTGMSPMPTYDQGNQDDNGFAEGGFVDRISRVFVNPNIEQNRREIEQMKAGTYQPPSAQPAVNGAARLQAASPVAAPKPRKPDDQESWFTSGRTIWNVLNEQKKAREEAGGYCKGGKVMGFVGGGVADKKKDLNDIQNWRVNDYRQATGTESGSPVNTDNLNPMPGFGGDLLRSAAEQGGRIRQGWENSGVLGAAGQTAGVIGSGVRQVVTPVARGVTSLLAGPAAGQSVGEFLTPGTTATNPVQGPGALAGDKAQPQAAANTSNNAPMGRPKPANRESSYISGKNDMGINQMGRSGYYALGSNEQGGDVRKFDTQGKEVPMRGSFSVMSSNDLRDQHRNQVDAGQTGGGGVSSYSANYPQGYTPQMANQARIDQLTTMLRDAPFYYWDDPQMRRKLTAGQLELQQRMGQAGETERTGIQAGAVLGSHQAMADAHADKAREEALLGQPDYQSKIMENQMRYLAAYGNDQQREAAQRWLMAGKQPGEDKIVEVPTDQVDALGNPIKAPGAYNPATKTAQRIQWADSGSGTTGLKPQQIKDFQALTPKQQAIVVQKQPIYAQYMKS